MIQSERIDCSEHGGLPVRVKVQLYAGARAKAGASSVEVELGDSATVADLKQALAEAFPALAQLLPATRIALNMEYANDGDPISIESEIAAIPPVSGGSALIRIIREPIDHTAVTDSVRSNLAGAVCSFLGTVRELTGGKQTSSLEYEAYPEMALIKLQELAEEARTRWPIIGLAVVHRVGPLELGEIAVVVAVSCPHRKAAFEACWWMMDTIKLVVPIWKRELWADGTEEWVHPGTSKGASNANVKS